MPEATDAQNQWVQTVLGVDPQGNGLQEGGEVPARRAKGPGLLSRVGAALAPKPKVAPVAGEPDPEVAKALASLEAEAAALAVLGFDATQMRADGADFRNASVTAQSETDEAKRTARQAAIRKRVVEAIEHARSLSKLAKKFMDQSKVQPANKPDDAQRSAIYKQALKDYYGLTIKVPAGMTNTHFDKVFEMMGTLPKADAKQSKFKKLTYTDKADDAGSGAYGGGEIEMGDFGDATGTETYTIDGVPVAANSFNVTTLHEIGHSVDDKHGIMAKHQGKAGCGAWVSRNLAAVAAAYLLELKKVAPYADPVTDADILGVLELALKSGDTTQPDNIPDDAWAEIVKFLADKCLPVRTKSNPWNNPIEIGGQIYIEAYPKEWWSYTMAARTATKVNNYQWRSPAEWFAEVYAISWLAKKPAPAAVDAAVVPYMWKG